jgi:predicted GIY-YIG superfamily endonuclease
MPRTPIDYTKTIMYKIVSKDLNNNYVYVGSTTDFAKRKSSHKTNCINENNRFYNIKVYKMIRENGGWNEFEMIEIEKYPCNDSNESAARERYWKEHFNANMNSNIPGALNVLGRTEYNKQPHIIEYQKQKFNCVCGGKHTYTHKSMHIKSKKHQNYLDNLLDNNHAENMEQIDIFLDDINKYINNLK